MTTVGNIYQYLDKIAPFSTQMDFDNAGLLVGTPTAVVKRAVLSLDITADVVGEAARKNAQLIISHHPVIFNPLRSLSAGSVPYLLAQNGESAICAHTNLDMAQGGVNDCLAARLSLQDLSPIARDARSGCPAALAGRTPRPFNPREFAEYVQAALGCDGLFFTEGAKAITRAGICGGAGADYLKDAASDGCQAFVTGEAKHHELIEAGSLGVTLIAAGHYWTENVVMAPLKKRLEIAFPEVNFLLTEAFSSPAHFLSSAHPNK